MYHVTIVLFISRAVAYHYFEQVTKAAVFTVLQYNCNVYLHLETSFHLIDCTTPLHTHTLTHTLHTLFATPHCHLLTGPIPPSLFPVEEACPPPPPSPTLPVTIIVPATVGFVLVLILLTGVLTAAIVYVVYRRRNENRGVIFAPRLNPEVIPCPICI